MDSILPKYEVTELPSRFIGYPEGIQIFIQPYTAGQAINMEMVGRDGLNSLEEVLEGVEVRGMDKDSLSPQDIIFLGVYRNLVSSKNDKINIRSYCPKCLAENNEAKSLAVIKFKELEGFDREVYPIEVEFDRYIMHFEFLTYKAFKYCMRKYRGAKLYQLAFQVLDYTDKTTQEQFKRPYYTNNPDERRSTAAFDTYISNVRGILYDLVDEDKDALDEVVSILEDYGTKPVEVTCQDPRCKHNYTVDINGEGVLVTPFREPKESSRTRVKLRKSDFNQSDSIQTNESEGSGDAGGHSNESSKPEQVEQPYAVRSVILPKDKPKDQIHFFAEEEKDTNLKRK